MEQNWGKRLNGAFLGVVFHENTASKAKEQNYFGHPQFYSSIAPMCLEGGSVEYPPIT